MAQGAGGRGVIFVSVQVSAISWTKKLSSVDWDDAEQIPAASSCGMENASKDPRAYPRSQRSGILRNPHVAAQVALLACPAMRQAKEIG